MLQVGRSRIRFPMRSFHFLNLPNHSSLNMVSRFTQPLTEMSSRKSSWRVKHDQSVRLTTSPPSVSRFSIEGMIHDISQPYEPLRPVTGIASLYLITNLWVIYFLNLDQKDKLKRITFRFYLHFVKGQWNCWADNVRQREHKCCPWIVGRSNVVGYRNSLIVLEWC
jgi:hypothetical protein